MQEMTNYNSYVILLLLCLQLADSSDNFKGTAFETSEWSAWSDCTATCSNGLRLRTQSCAECENNIRTEFEWCNTRPCNYDIDRDPAWAQWEAWGPCSVSCGNGTKARIRECYHDINALVYIDCGDDMVDYQNCELENCPEPMELELEDEKLEKEIKDNYIPNMDGLDKSRLVIKVQISKEQPKDDTIGENKHQSATGQLSQISEVPEEPVNVTGIKPTPVSAPLSVLKEPDNITSTDRNETQISAPTLLHDVPEIKEIKNVTDTEDELTSITVPVSGESDLTSDNQTESHQENKTHDSSTQPEKVAKEQELALENALKSLSRRRKIIGTSPEAIRHNDKGLGHEIKAKDIVKRGYADGLWSVWSSWSMCSALCGEGKQHRTRTCVTKDNRVSDSCIGYNKETHSCTVDEKACQQRRTQLQSMAGGPDNDGVKDTIGIIALSTFSFVLIALIMWISHVIKSKRSHAIKERFSEESLVEKASSINIKNSQSKLHSQDM